LHTRNFEKDESLGFPFAGKAVRKGLPSAEFAVRYCAEVGVRVRTTLTSLRSGIQRYVMITYYSYIATATGFRLRQYRRCRTTRSPRPKASLAKNTSPSHKTNSFETIPRLNNGLKQVVVVRGDCRAARVLVPPDGRRINNNIGKMSSTVPLLT
jgi:hypothetical protein